MITLHEGDNRESLRQMIARGDFVHSVVTDPPYNLQSISKRFGGKNAKPAKYGKDGLFQRASGGFMNLAWDSTGIERDPEFWRLVWQVMLPGAYLVAFSSSRTFAHMAVAIEEAGFITHPMIGWTFASGFPKAHNAARAIDKQLGVEGEFGGPRTAAHAGWIDRGALRGDEGHEGYQRPWMDDPEAVDKNAREYLGGSDEAKRWLGWSYGGQALKPALEPIYVGQKPFSEKNGALNILKHGVGAINIDGCRVPAPGETISNHARGAESAISKGIYGDSSAQETHQTDGQALGRWPANLIHDGSAEVVALFPDSKGQIAAASTSQDTRRNQNVYGDMARGSTGQIPRLDSGSAARFFNSFGYSDVEEIQRVTGMTWSEATDFHAYLLAHQAPDAPPILHYAKAGKKDRAGSKHATVKPVGLIEHLERMYTPPGGTILDPFGGSGTAGQAARNLGFDCILMEAEAEYIADIRRRFDLTTDDFDTLLGDDFDALLVA